MIHESCKSHLKNILTISGKSLKNVEDELVRFTEKGALTNFTMMYVEILKEEAKSMISSSFADYTNPRYTS